MKKYVCWETAGSHHIAHAVASNLPEEVFAAVHQPMKGILHNRATKQPTQLWNIPQARDIELPNGEISQEQVLEWLRLDVKGSHVLPIIGKSGAGKSHLVKWLYTQLEETESRKVIHVSKVKTTMYDILEMVLSKASGPKIDEFRGTLATASDRLSDEHATRAELLDALAGAVSPKRNPKHRDIEDRDKLIASGLENLLTDNHFRQNFWLNSGSILDRILRSVCSGKNSEDINDSSDDSTKFTPNDLPLDLGNVGEAAQLSQDFFRLLKANPKYQVKACDWLNKNKNEAVLKLLRLSGPSLTRLFNEVRLYLARANQGNPVKLVLLLEDFALLGGIDRMLVDSITADSGQGEDELCPMQTVLACTEGYFDDFPDTGETRIREYIRLKTKGVEDSNSAPDMVSRYLNAARVGEKGLKQWHDLPADQRSFSPPNQCDDCEFRSPCHEAFGEVDGRGLYPLNEVAVKKLAQKRVKDPDQITARDLIQTVITGSLYARDDLLKGSFPEPRRFNIPHFDLEIAVADALEKHDSGESLERRKFLTDNWATLKTPANLHPTIHSAFDLPEIVPLGTHEPTPEKSGMVTAGSGDKFSSVGTLPQESHDDEESTPGTPVPETDSSADTLPPYTPVTSRQPPNPVSEALKVWQGGGKLSPDVARKLKKPIHEAIMNAFDFDRLGITRSAVDKCFGMLSGIRFEGELEADVKRQISITLPIGGMTRTSTTMALLSALESGESGGKWTNAESYRRWNRMIEASVTDVAGQARHLFLAPKGKENLSIREKLLEMLILASWVTGRIGGKNDDNAAVISGVFGNQVRSAARTSGWDSLSEKLENSIGDGEKTQGMLTWMKDLSCATKGGEKGYSYQADLFYQVIESLKTRDWMPSARLTAEDIPSCLSEFQRWQDNLAPLPRAIADEKKKWLESLEAVEDLFGADFDPKECALALKEAVAAAHQAGCHPTNPGHATMQEVLSILEGKDTATALRSLRDLSNSTSSGRDLILVSQPIASTVRKVGEIAGSVESFFKKCTGDVQQRIKVTADVKQIQKVLKEIAEGLTEARDCVGLLTNVQHKKIEGDPQFLITAPPSVSGSGQAINAFTQRCLDLQELIRTWQDAKKIDVIKNDVKAVFENMRLPARKLRDTALRAQLFSKHKINWTIDADLSDKGSGVVQMMEVFYTTFLEDWELLKGQNFGKGFPKEYIDKLQTESYQTLRTAWRLWGEDKIPTIDRDLLDALMQIEAFKTRATSLVKLHTSLRRSLNSFPEDDQAINRLESDAAEARTLWEEIVQAAPAEVRDFLLGLSQGGASLDLFTDDVRKWLHEQDLWNLFVVQKRKGNYQ